ncbi:MAG: hypothetical protein GTN83_07560, partial [Acidobacteria bacterium]|nr:hypothetical protein [Acidobacteriota bacterium]
LIRDFVLEYVPNFGQNTGNPIADETNFTVNTNRTDGFCPGNAWYSSGDPSINFCQAEGTSPNTAWSSVIYHEYGHHL